MAKVRRPSCARRTAEGGRPNNRFHTLKLRCRLESLFLLTTRLWPQRPGMRIWIGLRPDCRSTCTENLGGSLLLVLPSNSENPSTQRAPGIKGDCNFPILSRKVRHGWGVLNLSIEE